MKAAIPPASPSGDLPRPLGISLLVTPQHEQLSYEANRLTAGWRGGGRPRRQDCSRESGKALANTNAQFS